MKHSLRLSVLFLYIIVILFLCATAFDLYGMERFDHKPTEDIEFTRCTCDSDIYCLTDEQYTVLMAQLSMRKTK